MSAPDTIVLIHGFWVTPRSWEHWIAHYEAQGLPGPRARLPRLRGGGRGAQRRPHPGRGRSPSPPIIAHLEAVSARSTRRRSSWATPPAASSPRSCSTTATAPPGVAINSAPTEGVQVVPLSQVKATFPVLKNPANRHRAVGFTLRAVELRVHQHLHRGAVARRCTSATTCPPRARSSGAARWPTSTPGHRTTWVDYNNDDRAPLLFISGSEDNLMPPKMQRSNAKHYKSDTRHRGRGVRGRPHLLPAQRRAGRRSPTTRSTGPLAHATPAARVTDVRFTHIGGPTAADRGRRLAAADRPDVRPARPALRVRLGDVVAQARRARRLRRTTSARSTPCCSPTTTTATTSTTRVAPCSRGRHGRDHPRGRTAARRRRPRARGRGRRPGSRRPGRPTIDGHRHAVPARAAAQPGRWRRRHRLRADAGRASPTARCGSPATPCCTAGVRAGRRPVPRSTPRCSTSAACSSRHRPAPLQHDRAQAVELCAARAAAASRCRCTTRAGRTSGRAAPTSTRPSPELPDVQGRVRWLPLGEPTEL